MKTIIIKIKDELADKFIEATRIYNEPKEESVTKEVLAQQLIRTFTRDTIRAMRVQAAQDIADEEMEFI